MEEAKWKRPVAVDVRCELRRMGYSKASVVFDSDEGDGYSIWDEYNLADESNGKGPKLEPHHYAEWAEQLTNLVDWLNKKANEEETRIENKGW